MSNPINSDRRFNQQLWSDLTVEASPFRSAFEHAAIGMVLADIDGRCLAANRVFCDMIGYTEAELLQLDFAQLTHPDDLPENLRLGQQLFAGEISSFRYEKRYFHKQGHVIWVLLSASLVRDNDGLPLYVISQIQDITAQKATEAAEREQRALAEALRDTAAALNSTLNMDELLDRLLLNVQHAMPHELASVMLVDADGLAHLTRYRSNVEVDAEDLAPALRFPVTTTTGLRRMAETARPLVIDDVRAWPGWNALPKLNWVRSYVGAPIITKQAVIGFIGLMSSQLGYFTTQHAERLQAFAQQAAIAIDNVRLFQAERAQSDLAEALRDTAAALNSTLDLDEVLDRILANASRVVPYDAINIMLLDSQRATAHVVRQLGYAERGVDLQITQLTVPLASIFGFRYMADTGHIYVVPDTRRAPDWVSFPETAWIRSYIGVPFQIDGQVGGFLNLDSATPEFFTHEHAARLRAFADQIAIAIRNARLFDSAQENLRRLSQVYDASLDIARANTLQGFHQQLLRSAIRLVKGHAAALLLYDGNQHLIVTAVDNLPDRLLGERVPLGHGLSGRAAVARRILQVRDYHEYSDRVEMLEGLPIAGAVVVPLIWQDRLVGTLNVSDHKSRTFDDYDVRTLSLFSTLAAIAVEQRRSAAEVEASETEARQLSARLSNAQEQERARIASLLHDTVGTYLVTLQKNTEMMEQALGSDAAPRYLAANLELLQRAHTLVRDLAADLDSRVLADLGLAPTVRQYIDRLHNSTGLKIDLHITGSVRRLSPEIERTAFRGLQEALTNALRHARASEIVAQLHLGSNALRLTIQDNGRGFNPADRLPGTNLGLPQLRRQVEALNGEVILESAPGAGTMIVLQLPLQPQPAVDLRKARVLIVDDHEMTRHGLSDLLAATDDLACIGEAARIDEALQLAEQLLPDVVLMDVRLPDGSGIDAARRLRRLMPRARIVILTYHDDEMYLDQAMQVGAAGYLLKSDHGRVVVAALRAVLAGETFISPALADTWARLKARPAAANPLDLLTLRERQVLQFIASGRQSHETAATLGISVRTVEVHRRNIMDKLGYRNTAQLVQFALQHGVV